MPISKNPGKLLTTDIVGSVDNFPREFLASIGIHIEEQQVPLDIDIDPLQDLLIESKIVQDRTNERKKTNTSLAEFPDGVLESEVFLEETGQTGARTRQLVPIDTPLTVDGNTEHADQANLGNGWMDQTIVQSPELFPKNVYGRERGMVTPEDFRALLQTQTQAFTLDGRSSPPDPLTPGTLDITDEDLTIWAHRLNLRFIDIQDLPQVNENNETNEFKQLMDVTRTLLDEITVPASPTSTKDVVFTKLGDGTALQIEKDSLDLFAGFTATKSLQDILPEIFKSVLPSFTFQQRLEGIVDPDPTFLPGEFTHREEQTDVFNKRVTVEGRTGVSYPQSIVALRRFGGEQFGGEVTELDGLLDDSEPIVDTGFGVVSSQVQNLGNGTFFRQTEKLDVATEWPDLHGQEYDESLDVLIPFIEKTIEEDTEIGTPQTDIKPIDQFHAKKRTIDSDAAEAVFATYLLQYPSKINVNMPDKLTSLSSQVTSQIGDAADSETGEVAGYGNYSINLDLRADATASASIIPEVFPEIKQFYGPNINCTHYVFFLPNPVTTADVLTKLTAVLGEPVVDWPKYNPETLTLLIVGENSALKVNAVSKGSYSQASDLSSQSSTSGGGTGYSRAKGLTIRRMQISPTIHDGLTVTGDITNTVDLTASCDSEAVGLGPAEAITQTDSVAAFVTPTSFPATCGATDWPETGLFLYRMDAKPYKYGQIMFHTIVVDAADFPHVGCGAPVEDGSLYVSFRVRPNDPDDGGSYIKIIGSDPDTDTVVAEGASISGGVFTFYGLDGSTGETIMSGWVEDTWVTLEMKLTPAGGGGWNVTPRVNGTPGAEFFGLTSATTTLNGVQFGTMFSGTIIDRNMDDLKIGTTGWGSSDVFSADFTTDIVPPFDSTSGAGSLTIDAGTLLVTTTPSSFDDAYASKAFTFP